MVAKRPSATQSPAKHTQTLCQIRLTWGLSDTQRFPNGKSMQLFSKGEKLGGGRHDLDLAL
ncbi:MAG: hypothetical protein EBZ50_00225 [Alphaproteobacteria bacterium]|jgi:hypothetical protein|nr:hypothetical protein [Alphaproteobacteria bacterium]